MTKTVGNPDSVTDFRKHSFLRPLACNFITIRNTNGARALVTRVHIQERGLMILGSKNHCRTAAFWLDHAYFVLATLSELCFPPRFALRAW